MDDLDPARRRLQMRMSRLAEDEVLVAVPVRIRGTMLIWMASFAIAFVVVSAFTGQQTRPEEAVVLGFAVLLVCSRMVAARQSWPVRLGLSGVLAVTPSVLLVASVSWWTGRPRRIKASWPRTSVGIELGPRGWLLARRVTVWHDNEASTVFESLHNRAWIGPALGDLKAVTLTGVLPPTVPRPAGWSVDPWAPPG